MKADLDPACARVDPDLWFPSGEEGWADINKALRAKRICLGCDLLEPCLAYALETRPEFGIWGATTPKERAKLRRAA